MQPTTPWVFGYGSLIWRPNFAYVEAVPAQLVGWTRRFWQWSPDHRGTPEHPGRVVTLLRDADDSVTGVAYRLQDDELERVLSALDHREKAGYERHALSVLPLDGRPEMRALVYVAGPSNSDYAGVTSEREIARRVVASRGPSGENAEYVLKLAAALELLGAHDAHVAEVAMWVRRLSGVSS